jgi:hypothetical protein
MLMRGVQLNSLTAFIIAGTTAPIFYNVLQISEGTNSVGIVWLDLDFCLCAVIASTFTNFKIGI